MKTDNELIAEFMGGNPTEHTWWNEDNLQYHSSWDWTMTSVVKIFKLYNESDHDRYWCKYSFKIRQALANADHPEVYKAVVEFIKWYNTNKMIPLEFEAQFGDIGEDNIKEEEA